MSDNNLLKQLNDLFDKKFSRLGKDLRGEVEKSDKRIMADVGDFIVDNVMPQIDEKLADKADKTDIERLERKLENYSLQTYQNSDDIKLQLTK